MWEEAWNDNQNEQAHFCTLLHYQYPANRLIKSTDESWPHCCAYIWSWKIVGAGKYARHSEFWVVSNLAITYTLEIKQSLPVTFPKTMTGEVSVDRLLQAVHIYSSVQTQAMLVCIMSQHVNACHAGFMSSDKNSSLASFWLTARCRRTPIPPNQLSFLHRHDLAQRLMELISKHC